jgi:DNA replication protein DnaC
MDTPRVLLEHYLKQLRLPTVLREFPKLADQCAKEGATFEQFLLRLVEQEMLDRERRATERRIKAANFPVSKSLETYDFLAIPSLNKKLVVVPVDFELCNHVGSVANRDRPVQVFVNGHRAASQRMAKTGLVDLP